LKTFVALVVSVGCIADVSMLLRPDLIAASGGQSLDAQQPVARASSLSISGTVVREGGARVARVHVRLRNVDKNAIVGRTVSDGNGAFSLPVPQPGLYVVEVVDDDGSVRGVGAPVTVSTSTVIANVILPASKGAAAAFFTSSAFQVVAAAAGARVGAWLISGRSESPER
jgi:hypothetical protein